MPSLAVNSQVVSIVLSEKLDVDDFLNIKHIVSQCVEESRAAQELLAGFSAKASGLSDADVREVALRWSVGEDVSSKLKDNNALLLMISYYIADEKKDYVSAYDIASKAAKLAPTSVKCALSQVAALRHQGKVDEALEKLTTLEREFSDCSEFMYQKARCLDVLGQYSDAAELLEKAVELDENNYKAIFHLANLCDIRGDDEEALELYGKIAPGKTHSFVNASINMALLYEDAGQYDKAISCCNAVLRQDPGNYRAKLYIKDIEESMQMYYSPEEAKESERIEAVLRVPVSDFELSVRSRNCLSKMNIKNLGDLVCKTEQEMLGYKNFGETSLREIKEMLTSRGLRLGMLREDGSPSPMFDTAKQVKSQDVGNMDNVPIDDLELSVRSRKCMERLGIHTLGQLLALSEADLVAAKNFGRVSLQEIKNKLAERSMSLRG